METHIKRMKMDPKSNGFAQATTDEQIERWRTLNTSLELGIPEDDFKNIEIPQDSCPYDITDKSTLLLVYAKEDCMSSLVWSMEVLGRFAFRAFGTRESPSWMSGEIDEISIRHGTNAYTAGFHWIRTVNIEEKRTAEEVIAFQARQDTYLLPTFEILQLPWMFPEIVLFINGVRGNHLGISGLQKIGTKTHGFATLPSKVSCICTLSSNGCNSVNELKRFKLEHIAEDTILKNRNVMCLLIKDA